MRKILVQPTRWLPTERPTPAATATDMTTTTTRISLESLPASRLSSGRAQTDMQQTMEQKFRSIESELNYEMKHSLQTVNDDIAELSHNFEDLSLENDRLRKELQKQWFRQDYMESQSRRQNIVFHNMPKKRPNETLDDCERVVREVIKDKLKIGADIQMDRAHCVGSLHEHHQAAKWQRQRLDSEKRTPSQTTGHQHWIF